VGIWQLRKEIICCSFLWEMGYWGARGQGKIYWKSDGECPSEVRRAHLGCGGHILVINGNGNTVFIVRQRDRMAGCWKWWAIFFVGWY